VIVVVRQETKRGAQRLVDIVSVPKIWLPHRDDEVQIPAPAMAKRIDVVGPSWDGLIGTVNVGGDFEQVLERIRHVLAHLFVDVFNA